MISDATAEKFAEYMEKYPKFYKELAVIIKDNLPSSLSEPLIVDVGVGPGYLPLEIFKLIPGAKVIGVDFSKFMLRVAHEKVGEKKIGFFKTVFARAEKIPLTDSYADVIVSRFSLTFWDSPGIALSEIYRILNPSGKLVLETLNKDFPRWRLFLIKIHMRLNGAGKEVTNYHLDSYKLAYSFDQLEKMIKDAGFKIIKTEGRQREWKFRFIAEKPSV